MSRPIAAAIRSTSPGVERRAPRQRGRVDRGAVGGEPRQALLVDQRGDAEPGGGQHRAVLADQLRGAVGRRDGRAAVRPGEVTEAVPARVGERQRGAGREHVLHGRDVDGHIGAGGIADVAVRPAAAELRDLLLEGHRGEQGVHALPGTERGVPPRIRSHPADLSKRFEKSVLIDRHHGTAPGPPSRIVRRDRGLCSRLGNSRSRPLTRQLRLPTLTGAIGGRNVAG